MRAHSELDGYAGPENVATNDHLREKWGCGFIGFQTYRMVHSTALFTMKAGEWNDWDTNIQPEVRGAMVDADTGLGLMESVAQQTGKNLMSETQAERRIIEMRRVPKYVELHDTPGWLLERWMAPGYLQMGPVEWENRTVPGTSLPEMGPFPHQGVYIHIGGPYREAPTGPFLDQICEQWEAMREDVLALAADTYVRKRIFDCEESDRERSDRWNREASAANLTAMRPFFSTYLEGGRARQLAAEHAGISSNYGN